MTLPGGFFRYLRVDLFLCICRETCSWGDCYEEVRFAHQTLYVYFG